MEVCGVGFDSHFLMSKREEIENEKKNVDAEAQRVAGTKFLITRCCLFFAKFFCLGQIEEHFFDQFAEIDRHEGLRPGGYPGIDQQRMNKRLHAGRSVKHLGQIGLLSSFPRGLRIWPPGCCRK